MRMTTIRLDDITADMNWEHFDRLREAFDRTGIYPLLGIVPDNHDPKLKPGQERDDFWSCMKELGHQGYVLSLHGLHHVYETQSSGLLRRNPFSEFAGLSFEQQNEKIRNGKTILQQHGIETSVFMAPGHTFDKNTLRALKNNGFRTVTDGYAENAYRQQGITFYPCTRSEMEINPKGVDTICLHPNCMTEEEIEATVQFIQNHQTELTSYKTMMEKAHVSGMNPILMLQIRAKIFMREVKDFAANQPRVALYLSQTNDSNKYKKLAKRMIKSPVIIHAFLHRNAERNRTVQEERTVQENRTVQGNQIVKENCVNPCNTDSRYAQKEQNSHGE